MTTLAGRDGCAPGLEKAFAFVFPLENFLFLAGLLGSDLLGEFVSIHGMLVRLLAEFVGRQVVFFAMGDRRG
jgi:hypothetical protein